MSRIHRLAWKHWPLAVKLILTTTCVVVVAVAGVTLLSLRREERSFRSELQQQAWLLLNTLVADAADPLYRQDVNSLYEMMRGLGANRVIVSGRIYDAQGNIVADARDAGAVFRPKGDAFGARLVIDGVPIIEWRSNHLLAGQTVMLGRERIGAVSIGLSTDPLEAKLADARGGGFLVAVFTAAAGVLLALLVSRSVTGPLRTLTTATRRIAGGDLTQRIDVHSGDEIALLAGAFNGMTARLRETIETLEQRVGERTKQLADSERELRQAKAFLEHLIDSSPGVIHQGDASGTRATYVSPNAERVLGYTPEEIVGDPNFWVDHIHPDDRDGVVAALRHAKAEKAPQVETEYRFLHKDGRYRWLHSLRRFEYDESGNLVGSVGFPRDITRRKESEEALRERQETLHTIFTTIPDSIIIQNLDGSIRFVGPSVRNILGYTPEERMRLRAGDLVHPEDKDRTIQAQRRVVETGEPGEIRIRCRHKSGEWVIIESRMRRMVDAEGRPNGIMLISRNVTEQVRLDDALRQAKEEAEEANKAKSEFLSRMSHELRTPLNAILGFGQILEMDATGAEESEHVDHILKAGRHLLGLIDEVLDISRIETGRLALSIEPVPVMAVVMESLELVAPIAAGRRVHLHGGSTEAPDIHVLADRQRLKQVFLNLLSNAVKYNREGGQVTISSEEMRPGRLRVKVTDTGPGIPPDMFKKLFIPFERLGNGKNAVEGTGLGLALSKRLIEAMGGTIGVDSTVGMGSTFWVELMLVESPVDRLARAGTEVPAAALDPRRGEQLILYIEDNVSNLRLIQHVLTRQPSIRLLTAMQGRVGLDLAREHRPHLILLDLHLPDISGGEVLSLLQKYPETKWIPVIVISADATPGQIERLRAAGARDYLTKPFDVKKLLCVLNDTLKEQGAADAHSRR